MKFYGLAQNPARIAGTIGSNKSDAMSVWTEEEFRSAMMVCENPKYLTIFYTLFYSGLRIGELMALTADDIDGNVIHVTKTFRRKKTGDVITPPKTPSSVRDVPMPNFVIAMLTDYIHRASPESRLFTMTTKSIAWKLNHDADKAGLSRIRIHDLRHSHATMLIHKGIAITAISQRLGHENTDITLKTYSHFYESDASSIVSALE